jgi:hypothetical protein
MGTIATAPMKCLEHDRYGSIGMHCPLCQERQEPPIRRTDVIEPPAEWKTTQNDHGAQ